MRKTYLRVLVETGLLLARRAGLRAMVLTPPGARVLSMASNSDLVKRLDRSPVIVFYEVTQACDLACLHCRANAQCQPHPRELGRRSARRLVEQLAAFPDPPMLVLTGGDPLKRPDIFELIEHARQCGLEVSITPSATPLVTRDSIRRLARAGISRLAVSLDGADAETHDRHRGVRGSFARTFEILTAAHEDGLATLDNTTLMPKNVHQIEELADLLAGQSIELWSVFFLVPVGRAADSPRLTAEQCEQAFERLWRQAARQPYRIKTTEAPHYRRFLLQHRKAPGLPGGSRTAPFPTFGLNDGKGILFVSHTGRISPSGFMPILCGTFPLDDIVDVYQRSPILQALRDSDRLQGKCGRCEFRRICGGSRARAFAVSGDPLAEEPDCIYQPGGSFVV